MKVNLPIRYSYNRPIIEVKLNGIYVEALIDTGAAIPVIFMRDVDISKYGLKLTGRNCLLKGLGGDGETCDKYNGIIDINGILFPNLSMLRSSQKKSFKLLLPAAMFSQFDVTVSNSRKEFIMENDSNQISYVVKVIDDNTGEETILENEGFLSGLNNLTLNS